MIIEKTIVMWYSLTVKNASQKFYSKSYKESASSNINNSWRLIIHSKLSSVFSYEKKILDVACGVSTLGKLFGGQVYGIDINREAIKTAKKNGIKAKFGDVQKRWEYPNEYFDVVIASHIIEHVLDPDHLLLEAWRVLKKNGLLLTATPNLAAWFNRILLLFGFQPFFAEVSTLDKTLGLKFTRKFTPIRSPLGHLRVFTFTSLKDIHELHGFRIVKTFGVEFLAFPFILLLIDKFFSNIPSLSSNIIVISRKRN